MNLRVKSKVAYIATCRVFIHKTTSNDCECKRVSEQSKKDKVSKSKWEKKIYIKCQKAPHTTEATKCKQNERKMRMAWHNMYKRRWYCMDIKKNWE